MPVVTLDSLKNKSKGQSDEEESGGNEYFTGGLGSQGHGSGLAVVAPNEGNSSGNPMRQFLNQIQQQQQASGGNVEPGNRRIVTVTMYRNGFTVNNGPLREPSDPNNRQFIESLIQGYCPEELVENGQPADVRLESKVTEEYQPPKTSGSRFSAFAGEGAAVGEIALSATTAIVPGTQGNGAPLIVNEAAGEIVRVQVKFPDGKKEVCKFEKHHTIRHLISRVELLRPNLGPYLLMSGSRGPPKPIEPSQFDDTLVNAGLSGALVTIKEVS